MSNMPDPNGRRLCEVEGYADVMYRYWVDPDGTLWSGPSIRKWYRTHSGTDYYKLGSASGTRHVSVPRLLADCFDKPTSTYAGQTAIRNPLRVAAITPDGDARLFDSARQLGKVINYQGGDIARTARHNAQILTGESTFSHKGIRRLRGWRVFLYDSLTQHYKEQFNALL